MRRLYHQPLSPFCRKIRLVLAEKKIEVELVEEPTWERRMDFLRMNPAGQVPVLKIDDLVLADFDRDLRVSRGDPARAAAAAEEPGAPGRGAAARPPGSTTSSTTR